METTIKTTQGAISLREAREYLKKEISKFSGSFREPSNYISHGKINIKGQEGRFYFLIYNKDPEVMFGVNTKTGEVLPLKVEKK